MATPSTVYGDEPVVFEVEGERVADARAAVEVRDQNERVVIQTSIAVPGQLRLASLSSGDFVLSVVSNRVSCAVTVNRELARGPAADPK